MKDSVLFDPIKFLQINSEKLSTEQINNLRDSLNKSISQFLSLKFLKDLTEEQIKEIENVQDVTVKIDWLIELIPDFQVNLAEELENFRKEFNKYYV